MRASTVRAVLASPRPTASVRWKMFPSRVCDHHRLDVRRRRAVARVQHRLLERRQQLAAPRPDRRTSVFAASRAIPRPRAWASPITKATASSSRLSASNLWAHPSFLHAVTSLERPSMPMLLITSTVVGLGDLM
jgi:hypothetical protein